MASHYKKELLKIVTDYRDAGGAWPARKTEVADWAIANRRWVPSAEDVRSMCGDALAEAMREQTFTDESGRTVRAMLPARTTRGGEQGTFWDDVRSAPIAHIREGVSDRRSSIAAEAYHLYKIVRYSNEHRGPEEQVQLVLDFAEDVKELDQKMFLTRPSKDLSAIEPSLPPAPLHPRLADSDEQPEPPRPSIRRAPRAPRLPRSSPLVRRMAESMDVRR